MGLGPGFGAVPNGRGTVFDLLGFCCIVLAVYINIPLVQVRLHVFSTLNCTGRHQVSMDLGPGFGAVPTNLVTVLDLLRCCCIVLALYIDISFVQVRSYVFSTPTCTGQHKVSMGLGPGFGAMTNGLGTVLDLFVFVVLRSHHT